MSIKLYRSLSKTLQTFSIFFKGFVLSRYSSTRVSHISPFLHKLSETSPGLSSVTYEITRSLGLEVAGWLGLQHPHVCSGPAIMHGLQELGPGVTEGPAWPAAVVLVVGKRCWLQIHSPSHVLFCICWEERDRSETGM